MGMYTRYKKDPNGLRQLVELWETTPMERRMKLVEAGMNEDPEYTQKILSLLINFEDFLALKDMELTEVIANIPAKMLAAAVGNSGPEVKDRIMKQSPPKVGAELRDYMAETPSLKEVGGGRLKLISVMRELERKGILNCKKLPSVG